MKTVRIAAFVLAALGGLAPALASETPASDATGPLRISERQAAALRIAPRRVASWIAPGVAASKSELIYLSVLTSGSSGQTNIYEEGHGTLRLVGQLNEGGGPVAVDSMQNVYVAESGTNVIGWVPRNIYVYARGGTKPIRILQNPKYMSWTMTVAKDGTVYVAGYAIGAKGHASRVVMFPPGKNAGTVIGDGRYNTQNDSIGLAVDANGNLDAGWAPRAGSACYITYLSGCVREFDPGRQTWSTRIAPGGAVNGLSAGPLVDSAGNAIVSSMVLGNLPREFLMTFPPGSAMPSKVVSIDPVAMPIFQMTFGSSGNELWAGNTLFNSSVPYAIWKLSLSGSIELAYAIPQTPAEIPVDGGIAVSPAFYP